MKLRSGGKPKYARVACAGAAAIAAALAVFATSGYPPATAAPGTLKQSETVLAPTGIFVYNGLDRVFIEWDANPEFDLEGYIVWRSTEGATPVPISDVVVETEFEDDTVEQAITYTYQVQAIGFGGVESALPVASGAVEGNLVTLFTPDIAVEEGVRGLYLSNFNVNGSTDETWLRIPISARAAYGVSAAGMNLLVDLPNDLVIADARSDVVVQRTGITEGMFFDYNIVEPAGTLLIVAAAGQDRPLWGSGSLFDVYVKLRGSDGCGDITLVEDTFGEAGGREGVRLFDVPGAIAGIPLDVELEPSELCVQPSGCLQGDVDDDGDIDPDDVQRILDLSVRLVAHNDCSRFSGDLNLDRRVDAADATLLLRWISDLSINSDAGLKSLEERRRVSYAAFEQGVEIEASVGEASGTAGQTITVPLQIEGAAPLAGFTATISYFAGPVGLNFDGVTLGNSLPAGYVLSAKNSVDGTDGSIEISASNTAGLGLKGATILANLEFTLGENALPNVSIPITLNAFSSNDPFGHTPRHGAPGQAGARKSLVQASLGILVTDNATGNPIPASANPTLTIPNLGSGFTTDIDPDTGLVVIPVILSGDYNVTVSADGFDPVETEVYVGGSSPVFAAVGVGPDANGEEGGSEGGGEPGGEQPEGMACAAAPGAARPILGAVSTTGGDLATLLFSVLVLAVLPRTRRYPIKRNWRQD